MRLDKERFRLSPTDLSHFLDCKHIISLDMAVLKGRKILTQTGDEFSEIITKKGLEHERNYFHYLQHSVSVFHEIDEDKNYTNRLEDTLSAIQRGSDLVYQGYLAYGDWAGIADFLIKDTGTGDVRYSVVDTKLSLTPKPSHISQVVIYAILMGRLGLEVPKYGKIVSPSQDEGQKFSIFDFKISNFINVVQTQMNALQSFVRSPQDTRPIPCQFCDLCKYRDHCKAELKNSKSIFELSNTTKAQEDRLRRSGIYNLTDLSHSKNRPSSIAPKTYERLVKKAQLRLPRLNGGKPTFHYIGPTEAHKELGIIPAPSEYDIFFDIEGDPFIDGGLEYLFGLQMGPKTTDEFIDIWSHNSEEEKTATHKTISILYDICLAHNDAHIYHYNAYEINALRKLSQKYEVLEDELDALLRANRFVDLYPIVGKNLLTSEKGNSLKDLEVFFLKGKREHEVQSAASSVVMYEKWTQLRDPLILEEIRLYNEQDCRSLPLLRDWLIKEVFPASVQRKPSETISVVTEERDVDIPTNVEDVVLGSLVKYHKREAKPYWWSYFDCMTANDGDLILDSAILAACSLIESKGKLHKYQFPEQEHKFSESDKVYCINPSIKKASSATITILDDKSNTLTLNSNKPLGQNIHLKETPSPSFEQIQARLSHVASSRKSEWMDLDLKSIKGCITQIDKKFEISEKWAESIFEHQNVSLRGGITFVQGPPGSGKTYQGAAFISKLSSLGLGKMCIVTAQSHKAIEHLLNKSADILSTEKVTLLKFGGKKKENHKSIGHFTSYPELAELLSLKILRAPDVSIVLGMTVYGVCKLYNEFDVPRADYLIIDEAGQYGLANAVACASVAENVILLGDQNQLPNVIQGTHPNGVGASVMNFCLGLDSIVPPSHGIFLSQTRRLHPNICSYISDKFYQSKLSPHEVTASRKLFQKDSDYPVDLSGIHLEELNHTNSSQRSTEEAEHIVNLIQSIKASCLIDIDGNIREVDDSDFIVIAPFNAQVKLIQSKLEETIRVGTVDRFQGQEAPIAIISMTSSSGMDAPKGLNFLLNRNRLNVAISRAQVACYVLCAKTLFESKCNTIEQMSLLSTFSALRTYASDYNLNSR